MKRTRLTAVEVEMEMQKAREERVIDGEHIPFTNGVEKTYVRDAIRQAQTNGKMHDKMSMVINPLYLHIPSWQRDLDGQHRVYGTFKAGIEDIVIEFLDISEKEAIDLFLMQTRERTGMTPSDYYKAAIAGEKPEYLKFRDICKKNNVKIKGDDTETVKNPVGIFTSLSDGISLTKNNPELLDRILKLIGKLQWNGSDAIEGKAYSAKVIRVLKKLYAYYEGNEKAFEKCLLDNCKGAEYYNKFLYEKWQDSLFDYLSKVLEDNMKDSLIVVSGNRKALKKVN